MNLERNFKDVCRVSQKKYTKLIKCNLKLITSINYVQLFLDCIQSNFDFKPSFDEIYQVLREIWLFEHEFQATNFGQLPSFGSIKFVNQLYIKLLNFIRISN